MMAHRRFVMLGGVMKADADDAAKMGKSTGVQDLIAVDNIIANSLQCRVVKLFVAPTSFEKNERDHAATYETKS